MALTDRERLVLDLIGAYQRDYPSAPGIDFVTLAADIEIVEKLLVPDEDGCTSVTIESGNTGMVALHAMLVDLRDRGLAENRDTGRWRVTGLLDRLAHEAEGNDGDR